MSIYVSNSWQIIDDKIAIKTMDKSVIVSKKSGIPKDIKFFFDADNLENGDSIDINIIYNSIVYDAEIVIEKRAESRAVILFKGELNQIISNFYSEKYAEIFGILDNPYKLIFTKINKLTYFLELK